MNIEEALANMSKRLNAVTITKEDLLLVTQEVHKLPPGKRDWKDRLQLMNRLFNGEQDKVLAIEERIVAMSALISNGQLPGWAVPDENDGAMKIAEPVWMAAASEPLLFKDIGAYFEASKFLDHILTIAEPDGNS
ncbi:MAG TPA: hypothetical protein PKC80_10300 [Burkholderiaceae bacterium]|nr:hypothetical protein [Burkholderiaceae bacterium]